MEFFGYKLSVLIAIICAAFIRVMRVKSKSQTKIGRAIETVVVFVISILFGLFLLHPIMLIFAIPVAYEVLVAMLLALSAELIVTKILHMIENLSVADLLSNFKNGKLKDLLLVLLSNKDDNK